MARTRISQSFRSHNDPPLIVMWIRSRIEPSEILTRYWSNLYRSETAFCSQKKLVDGQVQYISRNMHTVLALLCFVVVIHWLIFPYPSGVLHWHWGNLTIAPVPAKQPWWIWINTSCQFIKNDCITTTKQSTTKPCAYFLGYTVLVHGLRHSEYH